MDAILLQILNGLDKGGAYALIALGLTIIFGTLGVVNFAHGALFMLGAFVAVTVKTLLGLELVTEDPTQLTAWGTPVEIKTPYVVNWFGEFGQTMLNYSVPVSILVAIPVMLLVGIAMERGLIRFFYKRTHAEQILVTFGLAIVMGEIVKKFYGANPIPQTPPEMLKGMVDFGVLIGFDPGAVPYPAWRLVYFVFSLLVIGSVFAFLQFTTFGMVVRAGMADRETVGLLGIDIDRRFTIVFGLAAVVAGLAGVMYTPIQPPDYHWGMDFLVLSFVVVVVGGMGSLGGAVAAGFLLGILQSFTAMKRPSGWEDPAFWAENGGYGIADAFLDAWYTILESLPGLDQIIIYLIAVIILLVRPRGLMGRKGVMET